MKNAIITGGYGTIGNAIAEQLAQNGFRVFIFGRSDDLLRQSCNNLIKKTGNTEIIPFLIDLAEGTEIRDLAAQWNSPIDVLINNAVTAPKHWQTNSDGVEIQFAVNVLAYFFMMRFFKKFMIGRDDPRIINIASHWSGGLQIDDIEFKKRPYHNDEAYRQSKQADRMLTVSFAKQFKKFGITVNACHPGFVDSKLTRNLELGGHESAEKAAKTPVYLASSQEVQGISGKYFENKAAVACQFAGDRKAQKELYFLCRQYHENYVSGKPSLSQLQDKTAFEKK